MSVYVVDASVAAKWFLREAFTEESWGLLDPGVRLQAPDFLLLEMDSLFCKRLRRGHLAWEDAAEARALLRRLPIQYVPFASLQDAAFDMAVRTRRNPYDCLYLALAVQTGGSLVTADRRFFDAMTDGPLAEHVVWVEDVP